MFTVRQADSRDVDDAVAALSEAFAQDPLLVYLFHDYPGGVRAGARAFFSILLRVRLTLSMPADVLLFGNRIVGAAMGYDTSRPDWPPPFGAEWRAFENTTPAIAPRMAAYDHICEAHQPAEAHHYLGVIGVHPAMQGRGAGKALLDAFCARSRADTRSHGVYLDTTNPRSLQFYINNGFELRGEGSLDGAPVWCVFRPTS